MVPGRPTAKLRRVCSGRSMRAHPKLEHLDYHGSWEAYREAKARLFRSLDESAPKAGGPPKTAILNLDDHSYEFLRDATSARPVTYGSEPKADVHLESLESGEDGISLRILRWRAIDAGAIRPDWRLQRRQHPGCLRDGCGRPGDRPGGGRRGDCRAPNDPGPDGAHRLRPAFHGHCGFRPHTQRAAEDRRACETGRSGA